MIAAACGSDHRGLLRRCAGGTLSLLAALSACGSPEESRFIDPRSTSDAIVLCGERTSIGAPVVLWTDPGGYDATRDHLHFGPNPRVAEPPTGARFTPGRVERLAGDTARTRTRVAPGETDPARVAAVVDQLVLHYDACGTSRECFRILQDVRGLSVHFMIDLDGTIYQTLDLRDQAWHAGKANWRSIGVEIASPGAFDDPEDPAFERWYGRDDVGVHLLLPEVHGLRSPEPVPRPRTDAPVIGEVQGRELVQFDFTDAQYESLVRLTAGLCRLLPLIEPAVPRDETGRVADALLEPEVWEAFQGVVGHHHVSVHKTDPGPAFDWNGFLARVRAEL